MSSPPEERRNETKMYNTFTLKTVDEKYPNVRNKKVFKYIYEDFFCNNRLDIIQSIVNSKNDFLFRLDFGNFLNKCFWILTYPDLTVKIIQVTTK